MKSTESFTERLSALGHSHTTDGVDHINIYSRGKTALGQDLSHFNYSRFTHPYYGPFYSMEGFWYYMRGGMADDNLRYLHGRKAKDRGRSSRPKWYQEFREDILAANYQKIIQNSKLLAAVEASTLPFDHYYVFRNKIGISYLINPSDGAWLIEGLEAIRTAIKAGEVPACWINAEKRYKQG